MKDYDLGFLALVTLASFPAALILGVLIHELGHYVGGLLAGYRFTLFSVFGITVYRKFGGIHLRFDKFGPIGQCQMHPVTLKQNGTKLIIGGIIANLSVGLILILIGLFSGNPCSMTICLVTGGINIALGLQNLLPGSPTNDGSTLKDARSSPVNMEIYNRLMIVYMLLEDGTGPGELPDRIFEAPLIWESSLSAELSLFRYMSVCEKYGHERNGRNIINREYCRLKLYSPNTRILEAADDY